MIRNMMFFFKYKDGKSYILKDPCVKCGQCCLDRDWGDSKICEHLQENNECGLYYNGTRPHRCSCDNPNHSIEYCKVRYEEYIE